MVAVLAVKRLGDAKSRLVSTMSDDAAHGAETSDGQTSGGEIAADSARATLSPAQRERLRADPGAFVLAMLADTIATCLLYTSPSPRDVEESRMPSSA